MNIQTHTSHSKLLCKLLDIFDLLNNIHVRINMYSNHSFLRRVDMLNVWNCSWFSLETPNWCRNSKSEYHNNNNNTFSKILMNRNECTCSWCPYCELWVVFNISNVAVAVVVLFMRIIRMGPYEWWKLCLITTIMYWD